MSAVEQCGLLMLATKDILVGRVKPNPNCRGTGLQFKQVRACVFGEVNFPKHMRPRRNIDGKSSALVVPSIGLIIPINPICDSVGNVRSQSKCRRLPKILHRNHETARTDHAKLKRSQIVIAYTHVSAELLRGSVARYPIRSERQPNRSEHADQTAKPY